MSSPLVIYSTYSTCSFLMVIIQEAPVYSYNLDFRSNVPFPFNFVLQTLTLLLLLTPSRPPASSCVIPSSSLAMLLSFLYLLLAFYLFTFSIYLLLFLAFILLQS